MTPITSTQNKRVKHVQLLQTKGRARRAEYQIVLEGARLIDDALKSKGSGIFALYTPDTADYGTIAQLQENDVELYPVSSEVLAHVSDTQQPQGIVAVFALPTPPMPKEPSRILILDAIREPGNMGTILRTARAADVELVILAPKCVDVYNPKVIRAGMGAHFRLPIVEANWNEIMGFCEDIPVYITSGEGDTPYTNVDWTQKWGLIIGNEATGVGQDAQKLAQQSITIPMANDTESLNAGVASAIILFEAHRQRSSD